GQLTTDGGAVLASTNLAVLTTPVSWDLTAYFTYQGTVMYQGKQVYSVAQAPSYVPFKAGQAPAWVPAQLIGKTNQQLWNQYGLAMGGILAPPGSTTDPKVQGLVGPVSAPPSVQLRSPKATTQLAGYRLTYTDASGNTVTDPTPVNLQAGWNLLTRTVSE